MRRSKNWRAYAQTAFLHMRASQKNWGNEDFFRPITRLYYIPVFDCGAINHTGLISESAKNSPKERCHDHCLSPQFIGRMIMDNADVYLKDYTIFENLFWLSCSTITVTKKENKELSMLTENNGIEYKVYVPTNLKYKKLDIKLYRKNGTHWKNSIKCENNIIPVPLDLLNYEKNFLL